MNYGKKMNTFIFLLLMELGVLFGGAPPFIPYLTVLKNGEAGERVYTNRSLQYTTPPFDSLEIVCEAEGAGEEEEEEVNYLWNMLDMPPPKADKEFEMANGTLRFLSTNYGMFECFAETSQGISYSAILLSKHARDPEQLQLLHGPDRLTVPENSRVKYSCEVEAAGPADFTWTFNTQALDPAWQVEATSVNRQTLTIDKADRMGTVGCFVVYNNEKVYKEGSLVFSPLNASTTPAPYIAPSVELVSEASVRLMAGSSLSLACKATGTPAPALAWSRQNTPLTVVGPTLRLNDTVPDMSGEYRCTASNPAGRADTSTLVTVFNQTNILASELHESQAVLLSGQIRLECRFSVDARLANETRVNWFKNSVPMENISAEKEDLASSLALSNLNMTDAGEYSCRVETPLDSAARSWTIDIVYPPTILSLEPSKVVLLGSMAVLACQAEGSPPPAITWLHNGSAVGSANTQSDDDGSRLVIESVGLEEAGMYTCRASNPHGTDEKTFELTVAKPTAPNNGKKKQQQKYLFMRSVLQKDEFRNTGLQKD